MSSTQVGHFKVREIGWGWGGGGVGVTAESETGATKRWESWWCDQSSGGGCRQW